MPHAEKLKPQDVLSQSALLILKVAENLFSEKGFDAVSINEIAKQAEVSKANIFHHFKSKETLYLSVLKHACARSTAALDTVGSQASVNPLEQMDHFFSSHLQTILEESQTTRLIQRELMNNGERRGKQLAKEVFEDSFSKLVNLIRLAQSQNMVKPGIDPSMLAFIMLGANAIFFETRSVLKHMPDVNFTESPKDYNSAVFDLLINGFK